MPRQLKKKLLMDNEIVDHTHKYWKVMDLHSVNTARDFIISGMKSDIEMVVTFADNHPMMTLTLNIITCSCMKLNVRY